MTLNEAIRHCEEVAKEQENKFSTSGEFLGDNADCQKCAAEHRQLAEWLKDYKRLLEQEPCGKCIEFKRYAKEMGFEIEYEPTLDKVRAEIEEIETYDGIYVDRAYVLQIIDKYMESEE